MKKYDFYALWMIVCAAAYEFYDVSLIEDSHYDRDSLDLQERLKKQIPTYSPDTGQWVQDVMTDELHELTKNCIEYYHKKGNKFGIGYLEKVSGVQVP